MASDTGRNVNSRASLPIGGLKVTLFTGYCGPTVWTLPVSALAQVLYIVAIRVTILLGEGIAKAALGLSNILPSIIARWAL